MKGLLSPLSLARQHDSEGKWDGRTYRLLKPMTYVTKDHVMHTVPRGFVTDCATWLRTRGRFEEGAVMHDYLFEQRAGFSYANRIFKEMMERGGCPRWRVNMMYWGVCCFGWWSYIFHK